MARSKSRESFDQNFSDIDCLIDLHETLLEMEGEDDDGEIWDFSSHKSVVIKSSIVLMVSHWEAYVEDICSEAIKHIVENAESSEPLPKELKKRISKEISKDNNELKMWDLSGDSWRSLLSSRLSDYQEQRNWKFNSPKSQQVVNFFCEYLGVKDISTKWKYKDYSPKDCKEKLDEIVEVRGAIAHRGLPPKDINFDLAKEYSDFLKSMISKTGGAVNAHVKRICETGLF